MLMQRRGAGRTATSSLRACGKQSARTGQCKTRQTPSAVPLFCLYLVLLTIWAIAPVRAETPKTSTTNTYNELGQISSTRTTIHKEDSETPVSSWFFYSYDSAGELESVVFAETKSTSADDSVSRNGYFAGQTLSAKDLKAEQEK